MIDAMSIKKEPNDEYDVNDKDEMIEELRLCLPVWATRDQMLRLLTKSGGDIVKATSEFYERETEFYEQVPACDTKINTIVRTTVKNESVVLPKSPVKEVSHQSFINVPSLDKKIPSLVCSSKVSLDNKISSLAHSSKVTVSSKKRGSVPDKKSKKLKTTSATDSSGSKQAAITKFFKKQDSAPAPTGSLQPAITRFFKKTVPDNSQASKDTDATIP